MLERVLFSVRYRIATLNDRVFVAQVAGATIRAKTVLATGVVDEDPDLPNIKQAVKRGLIRHCPLCDGFEVIGKSVSVFDYGTKGALERSSFEITPKTSPC